jgi:hypothetical protein
MVIQPTVTRHRHRSMGNGSVYPSNVPSQRVRMPPVAVATVIVMVVVVVVPLMDVSMVL